MNLIKCKRAEMVSGVTIKWILYLAIVVAAGFAIKSIVAKFGG